MGRWFTRRLEGLAHVLIAGRARPPSTKRKTSHQTKEVEVLADLFAQLFQLPAQVGFVFLVVDSLIRLAALIDPGYEKRSNRREGLRWQDVRASA